MPILTNGSISTQQMKMDNTNKVFQEKQRFTQWWLWLILIVVGIVPLVVLFQQLFVGELFGDESASGAGKIVMAGSASLFMLLFWLFRLETHIDSERIHFRFVPFVNREINWSEVKKAEVVNYGFVGGWGIRWGTQYGTVYNVRGNKGLALELRDGKRLVLGTQKEEELKNFVHQLELKSR